MKGQGPLDTLLKVREHAVEDRAAAVRAQAEKTERARRERERAAAALAAERDGQELVEQAERTRVDQGIARAGDLAALAEWRRGAAERDSQLSLAQDRAEQRREKELQAEQVARAALAKADAEADAVELVRERLRASARRAFERREEELAAEVWNSTECGRRGKGGAAR